MSDAKLVRLKIITSETIIHSQLRSLEGILGREVEVNVVLNKRRSGSIIEFEVAETEVQVLKDRLGYTLLMKNEAGWIPVI
jgi:hypothetical protein